MHGEGARVHGKVQGNGAASDNGAGDGAGVYAEGQGSRGRGQSAITLQGCRGPGPSAITVHGDAWVHGKVQEGDPATVYG